MSDGALAPGLATLPPEAELRVMHLKPLIKGLTTAMHDHFTKMLHIAVEPLKQRIKELEQFPFEYKGTWQAETEYRKNNVITMNGGLWVCLNTRTRERPPSSHWQLAVKAGRDARATKLN